MSIDTQDHTPTAATPEDSARERRALALMDAATSANMEGQQKWAQNIAAARLPRLLADYVTDVEVDGSLDDKRKAVELLTRLSGAEPAKKQVAGQGLAVLNITFTGMGVAATTTPAEVIENATAPAREEVQEVAYRPVVTPDSATAVLATLMPLGRRDD